MFNIACNSNDTVYVDMYTDIGIIKLEINLNKAPITARNFLRYIDENRYSDFHFYRTVTNKNQPNNKIKIEVIQGGLGLGHSSSLHPIVHETTSITGLKHKNGTISMARLEPGSASSEIFICINDQPELDHSGNRNPDGEGFAAFGKVISGMEVVRTIHSLPNENQLITNVIKVNSFKIRRT